MLSDEEFVEFVRARSSALLRMACLLSAGDHHAGEDLLQAALLKTFSRRRQVRDPRAVEAYVRKVLVRMAIRSRHLSDRAHDLSGYVAALAADDDPGFGFVSDRSAIWPLLRSLPARQRAVVVLRYYEDLTEAEIADVLGCAPGTVKSHAHRALGTLRVAMTQTPSDPAEQERSR